MNRVFQVLYSSVRHCYVVVSEVAKRRRKAASRGSAVSRHTLLTAAIAAALLSPLAAPAQAADTAADGAAYVIDAGDGKGLYIGKDKGSATGKNSVIIGGSPTYVSKNTASGEGSVVIGGTFNTASGEMANVTGGQYNRATGKAASVSGGYFNAAVGVQSSVTGGDGNIASGYNSSVQGGARNIADASDSSISGGYGNVAVGNFSYAAGGGDAVVQGFLSSSIGGGSTAEKANGSVAIGYGSVVDVDLEGTGGHYSPLYSGQAMAIGYQATADEKGTISFGHDAGDAAGWELDNDGNVVEKAKYAEASYNRLVKIADGIGDHDAATVGQLKKAGSHFYSVKSDETAAGSNYDNDGATGADALAAGISAKAEGDQSIAISAASYKTTVQQDTKNADKKLQDTSRSTELVGAEASGKGSISMGTAVAQGEGSMALGGAAERTAVTYSLTEYGGVLNAETITEPVRAEADGKNSIALGTAAAAWQDDAIAIGGSGTRTNSFRQDGGLPPNKVTEPVRTQAGKGSIALGTAANAYGEGSVVIGSMAQGQMEKTQTVYTKDGVNYQEDAAQPFNAGANKGSIAVGTAANAYGENAIAIGSPNPQGFGGGWTETKTEDGVEKTVHHNNGIANVQAGGKNSIAMGTNARALGESAISFGTTTAALNTKAMAFGEKSYATGKSSLAMGDHAVVMDYRYRADGADTDTVVDSSDSLAIGTESYTRGISSAAIGHSAKIMEGVENGYSLGTGAQVQVNDGLAIGTSALAQGGFNYQNN